MICNVRCSCFLLQSSTGCPGQFRSCRGNRLAKIRPYSRNRHIQKTERTIIFTVSALPQWHAVRQQLYFL